MLQQKSFLISDKVRESYISNLSKSLTFKEHRSP